MTVGRSRRFERFLSHYQPEHPGGAVPPDLPRSFLARGFEDLMIQHAGCTFGRGLYRLHTGESARRANGWVAEAFPEFASRVHCFAFTWLGDQIALDRQRTGKKGENLVLMLEPGTGMGLEVSASFEEFHDQELVEQPDAAVGAPFFEQWAAAHPELLPLAFTDCVGYKVPLFLGGSDSLDNVEVIDLDVYWTITAQLRRQVEQI